MSSAERRGRGSARQRAARAIDDILASGQPATDHLAGGASGLADRDRRFFYEIVQGTLRWLRRLDHVIELASGRPTAALDVDLLAPLRIAVYQLLFLDRTPAYAAVNEAVREVRRRGLGRAAGLVNAVLRRIAKRRTLAAWPVEAGDLAERLAVEASHPEFLVRRYLRRFGPEATVELLNANNTKRPLTFLCVAPREEVARELEAGGATVLPTRLSPFGLVATAGDALASPALAAGRVYVQDDASQAAALVPPPRGGQRVLDGAAAPGGKTLALLTAEPDQRVVAADVSLARIERLAANLCRTDTGAAVLAADLRAAPLPAVFDRVVVDLPCSGTGTLSRHPELKWRLSEAEIERLARAGLELLEHAAELVCAGGIVCAVTCSIEPEENEEVVAAFTARRPEFVPVDLRREIWPSLAACVEATGRWRVRPTPEHDGFTVQVLRRRRS